MKSALAAVAILLLVSPLAFGQTSSPTIALVSGSFVNGAAATIAGSGLVQQDTSRFNTRFRSTYPTAWNMGGSSRGADGWGEAGTTGGTYDASTHLFGANPTLRFRATGTVSPGGELGDSVAILQDESDFWAAMYMRYELPGGNWPSFYLKMFGLYAGDGWLVQPDTPSSGLPTQFTAFWNGVNHPFNIPSGRLQLGRWYFVEIHQKWTAPRAVEVWFDGQLVYSGAPSYGDFSSPYLHLGIINLSVYPSATAIDIINRYGMFTVGRQRIYPSALVEVGNNSDYSKATKRVQALTAISDTSLGFTMDLTGLGTGPYYIWVTNNQQQRSAAFALGGGVAPSAPSNVQIK
jgi:hypothetical protein